MGLPPSRPPGDPHEALTRALGLSVSLSIRGNTECSAFGPGQRQRASTQCTPPPVGRWRSAFRDAVHTTLPVTAVTSTAGPWPQPPQTLFSCLFCARALHLVRLPQHGSTAARQTHSSAVGAHSAAAMHRMVAAPYRALVSIRVAEPVRWIPVTCRWRWRWPLPRCRSPGVCVRVVLWTLACRFSPAPAPCPAADPPAHPCLAASLLR